MLSRESAGRIARLSRRARSIAFCDGAADALVVAGLAAGSLLLVARLLGRPVAPSVSWSLVGLVLVAAVAWGALAMRRRTPPPAACAAWLDRRLALGGLLVTSTELDTSAWQEQLRGAWASADEQLPRLPLRRTSQRVALPLMFLAAIALLPAATPDALTVNPALADALVVEKARLDLLEERAALDPKTADELQARLDELVQRLEQREPVSWSDVDALAARGEAALALRLDALAQAGDALSELTAANSVELADQVGDVLKKLEAAGLLGELPPGLLERLGAKGGEGLDPSGLAALDAQALDALARDLQAALAGRFNNLAEAGLADPLKGARLAAQSAAERELAQEGKAGKPGHQHDASCAGGQCPGGVGGMLAGHREGPGRGGISRGRGDAALNYAGETPEAAEAFAAEQLPSTAPLSTEWTTTGLGLAEPEVAPIESSAGGGAGQAGAGAAAWQRRLAPHHRDVVKRFFERPK